MDEQVSDFLINRLPAWGVKRIFGYPDDSIMDAWDLALRADKPGVGEFYTDPALSPLPPHMKLEQIKGYLKALWKGDAEAMKIVKASAKEVLQ